MPTNSKPKNLMLLAAMLLGIVTSTSLNAADTHTIAVFQFRPENIAAIGYEGELMIAIRDQLSGKSSVRMMPKRNIESGLSRAGIDQSFSLPNAVKGGKALGVRYILIGSVTKNGSVMEALIKLIDVEGNRELSSWSQRYLTQAEIKAKAFQLVNDVIKAMDAATDFLAELRAVLGKEKVSLGWSPAQNQDVLGYNIYRSQSADDPFSYLASVNDTSHVDTDIKDGSTYFYQVAMVNMSGEEARSSRIAEITVPKKRTNIGLNPPSIISVAGFVSGAEIEFVPPVILEKKAVAYRLYRETPGTGKMMVEEITVINQGNGSINDEGLGIAKVEEFSTVAGGIEVSYSMTSVDTAGEESAYSESKSYESVAVPVIDPPATPLLRATSLRWTPASKGNGYKVFRRQVDGGWELVANLNSIDINRFQDTEGLRDGEIYEYALSVIDARTESELSTPTMFTTKPPIGPPESVIASRGLPREIKVGWQPHSDPDVKGYVIFRALKSTDSYEWILNEAGRVSGGSADTFVDRGELMHGQEYVYAVASENSLGNVGDESPIATGASLVPPPAVVSVQAQLDGESAVVSWEYSPELSSDSVTALIQRKVNEGNWQDLARQSRDQLQFVDEQLLPYANITYRVIVDERGVESEALESAPLQSPLAITLQGAETPHLRTNQLQWQGMGASEFNIHRRPRDGTWAKVSAAPVKATEYSDNSGMEDGKFYEYRIAPLFEGRELGFSNTIGLKTKAMPLVKDIATSKTVARQVDVSWQQAEDSNVTAYVVYRKFVNNGQDMWQEIAVLEGRSKTRFVDKGDSSRQLQHGQIYGYTVSTKNRFGGIGPLGASVAGNPKPVPKVVSEFTVFGEGKHLLLEWSYDEEANVDFYRLYRRWDGGEWQSLADLKADEKSYRDMELKPYVPVQYRIVVHDVDALLSDKVDSALLENPANITLYVVQENMLRKATLRWDEQSFVDGYQIYRREEGQGNWNLLTTLESGDQMDYEDTHKLKDGRKYEYRVTALEAGSSLGESNTVTLATKPVPTPPSNIVAISGRYRAVELSWDVINDNDVGGYHIYRISDKGAKKKLKTFSKRSENRYTDEGKLFSALKDGTEYHYVISAFNNYKAEGPGSEPVAARTKHPPRSVAKVEANYADGKIAIAWAAGGETDLTKYEIHRSSKSDCSGFRKYDSVSAQQLNYRDQKISAGAEYCYRIVSVDSDGLTGGTSVHAKIRTPAEVVSQ